MNKEKIEIILNKMLATGGDFAEVFWERKKSKVYSFVDSKLDAINIKRINGLGLRLASGTDVYYGAINNLEDNAIAEVIDNLTKNIDNKVLYSNVKLDSLERFVGSNETHYTDQDVKKLMQEIDNYARNKDDRVLQVNVVLQNNEQTVTVANHTGRYKEEVRVHSRIFIIVTLKDEDKVADIHFTKGTLEGLDFLDKIDFHKEVDILIKEGLDKLYAKPCLGKVMPVVIEQGFGGVIFHEACGHALEATSVAPKISVLSDLKGEVIASPKVTIIDDGTLLNEWGSSIIDDEGNKTQRNVLIENGVLKNYLIDEINNRKMHDVITGSGRRESYLYAPTSRMNNTYLEPGTDTFVDMISSIKLGLYCAKMGGGSVSPETGDFNFACDLAYMIRDGKICECVKSASLIGNTKDILKSVEMVGSNLALGPGMCGSISGSVPVNVGIPTIKVSHILVGGYNEE